MSEFHQKVIELVKRARCAERNFRAPVGPHAHTEWRLELQERRLIAAFDAQAERIAELEGALRFYADCEWGWNGGGGYEPMIVRLPDDVPQTLDCKFAGSVARAALEEAHDE